MGAKSAASEDTPSTTTSQVGLTASREALDCPQKSHAEDEKSHGEDEKSHVEDAVDKAASDRRTFLFYARTISPLHRWLLILEMAVCGILSRLPSQSQRHVLKIYFDSSLLTTL